MTRFAIIFLYFISTVATAQTQSKLCGFDLFVNRRAKYVAEYEDLISREFAKKRMHMYSSHAAEISIIPVVVHVIHNGGAENISDAQINSQIQILNEDFRRIFGSNGYGNGVDTKIEFCLAKVTPDGKCTNGIVRIKSPLTNHQTYQRSLLKDLSFWPPDRYLNIYIVNSINGGILGYSSFPGGPSDADGVVIRDDAFGNIGTVVSPSNLGRTLTHEISHWFGLYHTFQDGCGVDTCTDGDKVCDTPPVATPNFGCPTVNSCNNDLPDVNDQIQNYCDYTDDACKNMFTTGQSDRMHATLSTVRTNIWSPSNILATGCDTSYTPPTICPVVADFTVSNRNICIGSNITFTNISLNNPTGYFWTFTGASITSSSLENPTVTFLTVGTFPVSLKIWNSSSSDSISKFAYITVSSPTPGNPLGINEGFESSVFPPSAMVIENADTGVTWQRTSLAAYQGLSCIRINNLINVNYGQSDAIVLPAYDFTTYSGTPFLRFRWAYAQSSSSYSDELLVLVSKDCGLNWQQVFYRSGSGLATSPVTTSEYIPDATTVWKTANINLNSYSTQTNVIIKIVNVTDGGNCLYLDNINMGDTTLNVAFTDIPNTVDIYPNPIHDELYFKSPENMQGKKVIMYDIQGKLILTTSIDSNNKINVGRDIPSGIYIVKLISSDSITRLKFVKE